MTAFSSVHSPEESAWVKYAAGWRDLTFHFASGMQEKSAGTSQNKSFVSVLWDLPAALCRNKLFLRNLLITGLSLEKQALRWQEKPGLRLPIQLSPVLIF